MTKLSQEQLNNLSKEELVAETLKLQDQYIDLSQKVDFLTEQIMLMNQRQFGRKTEKNSVPDGQLNLFEFFNEVESLSKPSLPEPDIESVVVKSHSRKVKGKREEDLKDLPVRIINHTLSEEELKIKFPNGYKELPNEIYKRLCVIPATFIVDEHHVHVYASLDNDGTIIKAQRSKDLLRNSIATPSVVASCMNAKYALANPLDRQSRCFKDNGVNLSTNTLANWMIRCSEDYLSIMYDILHKKLYNYHLLHADETPVRVSKDGRPAGSKSYMWVYRGEDSDEKNQIVLYDYQKTRKLDHPREFLKDFKGIVVTDGYQVYHSIDKERQDLTVAGCWVHSKRKFSEINKAFGRGSKRETMSHEAEDRISKMFAIDKSFDGLSIKEREKRRQSELKPLVDDFFTWAKETYSKTANKSALGQALSYCINQEQYLRVFLDNGNVPMDNNAAERAIRPFTVGRKNWVLIDTIKGAKASAVIYSLVETAKANNLRTYEYLELLLTEIPNHLDDKNFDYFENLMPWSDYVKERCHTLKKS